MQQHVTTKSWLIANFEICAFAAASIAGFYILTNGDGTESKLITKLIVVTIATFIVSNILASRLTKFASSNFEEVLSVRVLFKNSNTEIYTMKAKYLIDRFTNIAASITIGTAWLVICTFFPTVYVR